MRIPLDYYRILGLPLAASEEQLRQAHSDRIVQLPRREYSQAAISSRKQLIETAYVVLSNPKERSSYDQLYLSHAYDPDGTATATVTAGKRTDINDDLDSQGLSIEIPQQELVGALLILQELGEYELVLKLGNTYLANHHNVGGKIGNHLTEDDFLESSDHPDIVLTVALACLELGREQWQQGYYENAAISLESGLEMLFSEGIFSSVQAEIQADLYKLRPYRVLELLELPLEKTGERRQGLELLQSILDDRGGIDGTNNDQSGLSIDDFLRFIQQIRHYLTVAEQHKLFEAESKRPSAVATYLAVYALIARGFAQRQPALIRQARQMLMHLGKRQDVHLEQSLCALLLGQTEEATRVLEMSQEYEALAFIREKSQDSPDLLPGLCLYGEQWLQHEVFPHFRDLSRQQASLKDYFANSQVQAYLEALPTDAETSNDWGVINRQPFASPQPNNNRQQTHAPGVSRQNHPRMPDLDLPETPNQKTPVPRWNTSPAPVAPNYTQPSEIPVAASTAERPEKATNHNLNGKGTAPRPNQKRRRRKQTQPVNREYVLDNNRDRRTRQRRTVRSSLDSKTRLVWTVFASLAGILVFWLIVSTTFGWVKNLFSPTPALQGKQLSIQLNQPPIEIPNGYSELLPANGPLTDTTAEEVIRTWLSTKALALGPNHDLESLNNILTGSSLSQWRLIAQQDRLDNRYRQYDHSVKVEFVSKNELDPNRAAVLATVKEVTQFYENGQKKKSSNENLRVRYDLIRREGKWLIQSMYVVNQVGNNF
ncbi:IMS domain-containing protein [Nostoc sp. CHAB 5844]|nr:IMS domain-containing protein [Nostoc sp. CHAB 5844]